MSSMSKGKRSSSGGRSLGPATTEPALDVPKACPQCHSERVTRMAVKLTDGTPVTLMSCGDCDTRTWWNGAERLDLQDVVDRSTKQGATGLDLRERKRTDPVPPANASRRTTG
jgi:transcription elongation factor Elf1